MSIQLEQARRDIADPLTNGETRASARFIVEQNAEIQAQDARIVELEAGVAAARTELVEARDFIRDEMGHVPTVTHLTDFINDMVAAPTAVVNIFNQVRLIVSRGFEWKMNGAVYNDIIAGIDNLAVAYGAPVAEKAEDSE